MAFLAPLSPCIFLAYSNLLQEQCTRKVVLLQESGDIKEVTAADFCCISFLQSLLQIMSKRMWGRECGMIETDRGEGGEREIPACMAELREGEREISHK